MTNWQKEQQKAREDFTARMLAIGVTIDWKEESQVAFVFSDSAKFFLCCGSSDDEIVLENENTFFGRFMT